jgi:hypothetical protein
LGTAAGAGRERQVPAQLSQQAGGSMVLVTARWRIGRT